MRPPVRPLLPAPVPAPEANQATHLALVCLLVLPHVRWLQEPLATHAALMPLLGFPLLLLLPLSAARALLAVKVDTLLLHRTRDRP